MCNKSCKSLPIVNIAANMDVAIPVTLIVKAPNQQFEDQTIQCELTWNIKRLKGYLSEVYPCKPVSKNIIIIIQLEYV